MLVGSYNSKTSFFVIIEKTYFISGLTLNKLHLIPCTNSVSSRIADLTSFLLITMFHVPLVYKILLITLLFLLLSNMTDMFLWHVMWFEWSVSRKHESSIGLNLMTLLLFLSNWMCFFVLALSLLLD